MNNVSADGLRASEIAGRVYDKLCSSPHAESQCARQQNAGQTGGASLDYDTEAAYLSSHNTSVHHPSKQFHHVSSCTGSSAVEIARREAFLRRVYNEKLRGSIQAIFGALMNELPQDHILLQLISDSSTEQYCRVRVAEVVENFLFSMQAHQYHNLATELAKRDTELLVLTGQLETLERRIRAVQPLKTYKCTQTENCMEGSEPVAGSGTAVEWDDAEHQKNAVQAELIAILGEVMREHEVTRFRECLAVPTSLVEMVQSSVGHGDKYEYLSNVVSQLFRALNCLVTYAEESLRSVSTSFLDTHGAVGLGAAAEPTCLPQPVERNLFDESQLPSAPSHTRLTDVEKQHNGHLANPLEEERGKITKLMNQLKRAESSCTKTIHDISTCHRDLLQKNSTLQQQLQLVTSRDKSHQLAQALTEKEIALSKLEEDLHKVMAEERLNAERRYEEQLSQYAKELRDVRESLVATRQKLHAEAERRRQTDEQLREEVEQRRVEEHSLQLTQAMLIAAQQGEQAAGDVLVSERSELCKRVEALQKQLCEERLSVVTHRAESVCARLECNMLNAYTAKLSLLQHGHEQLVSQQRHMVLLNSEAARHAEDRASAANSSSCEREEVMQQCREDLCELLSLVRADEGRAKAIQNAVESAIEAQEGTATGACSPFNEERNKESGTGASQRASSPPHGGIARQSGTGKEGTEVRGWECAAPKTLPGVAATLRIEYAALQLRLSSIQRTAEAAGSCIQKQRSELLDLHARLKRLNAEYKQHQTEAKKLWISQTELSRQGTLKNLLAKQQELLATVEKEREDLRRRWEMLSEEYYILEKRNSRLHERCVVKAAENTRLMGVLRAKSMTPTPTQSPEQSDSSPQGSDVVHRDESTESSQAGSPEAPVAICLRSPSSEEEIKPVRHKKVDGKMSSKRRLSNMMTSASQPGNSGGGEAVRGGGCVAHIEERGAYKEEQTPCGGARFEAVTGEVVVRNPDGEGTPTGSSH
uniref:WGS project CAEQ00000000 data, annotated contig 984 n=1 Tax=Trypanosoma congolense (strain IL3000) TaxID=1068625 RepID=F9WK41_TRYCI|nr:unnamed protein product [Trypanosoma congolense IL3000]